MKHSETAHEHRPLLDALSALRDVSPVMGQAEDEARRRSRIAARIVATQTAWDVRKQRRRGAGILLAAALCLGGWSAFVLSPGPDAHVPVGFAEGMERTTKSSAGVLLAEARGVSSRALADLGPIDSSGLELVAGELRLGGEATPSQGLIWTATERSRVRLENDVELELERDTQLRVEEHGVDREVDELQILRGTVRVASKGRARVSVRTQTVRIDALGARFSVSLLADDTRVDVASGSVRLERRGRAHQLLAGERWTEAGGSARNSGVSNEALIEPSQESPTVEAASLAEQNRMFQAAVLAKQRGLGSLALRRLDELLAAHPAGPLSENARVERLRILSHAGNEEAARQAAKTYLTRHPTGFARREAEELLDRER